jgi:hypothetical protein
MLFIITYNAIYVTQDKPFEEMVITLNMPNSLEENSKAIYCFFSSYEI